MKIVCISDTHGRHNEVKLPDGDILIHAGDVSSRGSRTEIVDFLNWFKNQMHTYKIFIAGNHDWYFEKENQKEIQSIIPDNIIYLNDSGCEIMGMKVWGSPIQPFFFSWAFNRERGKNIKKHWDLIPNDTDILITHGPPYKILDKTIRGEHVGCEEQMKKVDEANPLLHVFGHIHEAYGFFKEGKTTYVNASLLNHRYYLINDPIVIDLDIEKVV